MKKRIVLACGGTGGHINPALAVAEVLRQCGHELALILSGTREAEAHAAAKWQGKLLRSGARRISDPRNLLAWWRCLRFLREYHPDVLFATGGYTCVAPVLAARFLKIPVVLHEANSLPGKAIVWLSKHFRIAVVATSFAETAAKMPWVKSVYTGLPLRESVVAVIKRAQQMEHPAGQFSVLVTGGSQGARGLDRLVAPVLASLAKSDCQVRVVHQCCKHEVEWVRAVYKETPDQVTVVSFIEDMGAAYGRADLAIARAGAATCCELACCAVPTIFIPLPTAVDDHQRKNAEALVRCGGALCFDQLTTSPDDLAEAVRQFYSDPLLRRTMREALLDLPHPDAARSVAELILSVAR